MKQVDININKEISLSQGDVFEKKSPMNEIRQLSFKIQDK